MGTHLTSRWPEAYQTKTFSDGRRERIQDIYRRVQPFGERVMTTLRSIEFLDLLLKDKENAARGVAIL